MTFATYAADVPVASMSQPEFVDFAEQLFWAVVEESPLYEVPLGVTDIVDGRRHVHGPWVVTDCSEALLGWFDAGLLELYRRQARARGPHLDVPHDEARRLLLDTTRWTLDDPGAGDVCLVPSEDGVKVDRVEWVAALARLRRSP